MRSARMLTIAVAAWGLMLFSAETGRAGPVGTVGTAFTYQGALMDTNQPADGLYDLQFRLYDHPDPNIGWQWGDAVTIDSLDVIEGYFTVMLDFNDGVFTGDPRWLELGVRAGDLDDPNEYTILLPRQRLTPTPYAIHAETASRIVGQDSPTGVENQIIPYAGPYDPLYGPTSVLSGFNLNDLSSQLGRVGLLRVGPVVTGSTIYENGSNVGIGTIIPNDILHLYDASDAMLAIQRGSNSAGDQAGIKFKVSMNPSDNWYYAGIIAVRNAASTIDLHLATQGNSGEINVDDAKLTVLSGGNVGIGTTSPNRKIHVSGSGDSGSFAPGNWQAGFGNIGGGTGEVVIGTYNNYPAIQGHGSGTAYRLLLNPTDGNVGIGTTSPTHQIHVSGSGDSGSFAPGNWQAGFGNIGGGSRQGRNRDVRPTD